MSALRWKKIPPVRQDQFGYYLCRLCQNPCPGSERQWCSNECLQNYLTLSSGAFIRAQLLQRDGGKCSLCGVDAAQMDRALANLKADLLHPMLMSIHPMIVTTLRSQGWTNVRSRGRGSYPDAVEFKSCWEAHHAHAVIEGGGECGLENFRTLCFVCHKRSTADLAGIRARKRQLNKVKPVPSIPPVGDEIPF